LAQSDIMIVDDNPANLKLLEDMLVQQGYEVRSFPRGRLALAAAMKNPPDLILLDINMPEINGYEVCERLKSTGTLSDIPVIFLSALNETQDKVKAFQSGAVDYISKPFEFEEIHARVEMHLKLHDLQRALKLQNERLEEAVAALPSVPVQACHLAKRYPATPDIWHRLAWVALQRPGRNRGLDQRQRSGRRLVGHLRNLQPE
jgi:DNA-binding response OmpR family regulator